MTTYRLEHVFDSYPVSPNTSRKSPSLVGSERSLSEQLSDRKLSLAVKSPAQPELRCQSSSTRLGNLDLFKFQCKSLAKVELHAHLNGSVSWEALRRLAAGRADGERIAAQLEQMNHEDITLDNVFSIFKMVHTVVSNEQALFEATASVLKDFHEDNVVYLELRTTPRAFSDSFTKLDYLKTVSRAIAETKTPRMRTQLLVSFNRAHGLKEAAENLDVAVKAKAEGVPIVGIDLSGNPAVDDARNFLPLFRHARLKGLKISVHLAEQESKLDEVMSVLEFVPDRIGHATNMTVVPGAMDVVITKKIPLELCLSSNVICKTVENYTVHHIKFWKDIDHPLTICTDDTGVFRTSLTQELVLAMLHCEFSLGDVQEAMANAASFIFDDSLRGDIQKIVAERNK